MEIINSEKEQLYVYVDESGSITKTNISNNRYFVIAMIFTKEPEVVRKLFKKKISQLMKKNKKYQDSILFYKEIKGSDISETVKSEIYEHVLKHAAIWIVISVSIAAL